jgi:hypothetical protein
VWETSSYGLSLHTAKLSAQIRPHKFVILAFINIGICEYCLCYNISGTASSICHFYDPSLSHNFLPCLSSSLTSFSVDYNYEILFENCWVISNMKHAKW